jgi:hypothetical protein
MSRGITLAFVSASGLIALSAPASFGAATVNYQGYVYNDVFSPAPAFNVFAVAGTFAPGFDPYDFNCYYADDDSCNLFWSHYSEAVADGIFTPIGEGDLTDGSGFFSGSGTTLAAMGTPVFLFAFDTPDPNDAQNWALVTSSHPSFAVPANLESTTVHTAVADSVAFGYLVNGGIALNVLPFPEPSTTVLALIALASAGVPRRRRHSACCVVMP